MDVSGFRPEEIKVGLKGNKIVVTYRQFVRPVSIPAGIDKATIKSDMENDGRHLCIWALSESATELREIPINFKQCKQPKKEIKFEIHH
jgi:nucleoside diphosphate kinase